MDDRTQRGTGRYMLCFRTDDETVALVDAHVQGYNDTHPDESDISRADWLRWVIYDHLHPARRPNRRRIRRPSA